jgi:hypothetical protein
VKKERFFKTAIKMEGNSLKQGISIGTFAIPGLEKSTMNHE